MKVWCSKSGFTLIEILISLTLASLLMVIGLSNYDFFESESILELAKQTLDSSILTADVNSVAWKSMASEKYWNSFATSNMLQVGRYMLFIKKDNNYSTKNKVYYWELQKWVGTPEMVNWFIQIVRSEIPNREYYELVFTNSREFPIAIWVPEIFFAEYATYSKNNVSPMVNYLQELQLTDDQWLLIVFDSPFGNVSFAIIDWDIPIYKSYNSLISQSSVFLTQISWKDDVDTKFIDFSNIKLMKGKVEIVLQYKQRASLSNGAPDRYLARESVRYNSKNEISHYWD